MNRKIIFPSILSTILFMMLVAVILAMWNETLIVNIAVSTGEIDFEIYPGRINWMDRCGTSSNDFNATYFPNPGYTQLDENVGCTDVELVDSDGDKDYDTMQVTLDNVYPWYYTKIFTSIANTGTIPIKIWKLIINGEEYYPSIGWTYLDIDNDKKPDVLVVWKGPKYCEQLHPNETTYLKIGILVLPNNLKESRTSFSIYVSLVAMQWNKLECSTTIPTYTPCKLSIDYQDLRIRDICNISEWILSLNDD